MKSKDQVLSVFKQFQAFVERETRKKLKCIRSDNGGEYCGSFDEYYKQHGIRHQKTPPKTPQLNGLAERMNRTLVERVKCLLSKAKLPGSFWGEALYTATHVINLSPAVALQSDVPNRVWYGKDVSYDHLHVFGYKVFVHVPKDERSKLDAKTRQCVFIGYGHHDFGHRFYDPIEKKLVRSRDVIFMEVQSIEDIDKVEKSKSSNVSGLVDLDPIPTPISMSPNVIEHDNNGENVQDVQVENNVGDNIVVDAPAHRAIDEPTVPLRRVVLSLAASLDLEVEQMDVKIAFLHGDLEENIYMKQPKGFVVKGYDLSKINFLKKELSKSFAMKDLGLARQILGMEIIRDRKSKKLWLSQEKYIEKVLQQFHMNKAKAVSTPLANHFKLSTRHAPSDDDEKARMQHIPYRPAIGSLIDPVLHGYTNSNLAGDVDTRKSTSSYLVNFAREVVAWQSKLQKCVALSTTEAKFIATTEACKELLWMKKFICELGFTQKRYILYCDSQSAIYLCKNPTFHGRSKHIDVKYHWIRDVLDSKSLELVKIHTNDNCLDMLTKILPRGKFEACCVGAVWHIPLLESEGEFVMGPPRVMSPRPQTILYTMHLRKRYSIFPMQTEKRIARNKIESPISNANIVTENPVTILYAANSPFGDSAIADNAFGDAAIVPET
ncbi:hypothetical protein L6164_002120 [Bauhinia variegata]|uniref:Uncharacterized protein n=1 Tax=Bauhinia variegata TaxID=167791 RepID=A0ACB9Q2P9_BAUVA|nr:hypothetical protein L6164_002120 [Bauhinia variegata]